MTHKEYNVNLNFIKIKIKNSCFTEENSKMSHGLEKTVANHISNKDLCTDYRQ